MTRAEIEAAMLVTKGEPTFPATTRLAQLQIGLLLDIREGLEAVRAAIREERESRDSAWTRAVPEPKQPRKGSR